MTPITSAPITELELLKQPNALLLRRLIAVSRERDQLAKQVAAFRPDAPSPEGDERPRNMEKGRP